MSVGFEWGGGGKPDYGPQGCCQTTMLGALLGGLAVAALVACLAGWAGRR